MTTSRDRELSDEEEEHGCHVVEWTGAPWINQDTRELMCEAVCWNKVPKTKHWCTRNDPPEKETFVLNHVLLGDLPLCKIDEDNEVPKGLAVSIKKSMIKKKARKVLDEHHEFMMQEMNRRALVEIKEKEKQAVAAVSGASSDNLNAK